MRKSSETYSDEEAEQRATDALRRVLTTAYTPQRDLVGKLGRKASEPRKVKRGPASPKGGGAS